MPTEVIAPLVVADEAFLVASLIERCPKTMMLRELLVNAVEAALSAVSEPPVVSIDAKHIDGTAKLRIWNNGIGLSSEELDRMCDLASSIRKQKGLANNFGMGAKVASLPSNRHGMVYRSCKAGRVHQVIIGSRDGTYGRLSQQDPITGHPSRVIEVTGEYGRASLNSDWTEVVLLGNRGDQDSVSDPYNGSPPMRQGWVRHYLRDRFFRLPDALTLKISPETVSKWHRASADQGQPPLDQRPGRADEPHHQGCHRQTLSLRQPRAAPAAPR